MNYSNEKKSVSKQNCPLREKVRPQTDKSPWYGDRGIFPFADGHFSVLEAKKRIFVRLKVNFCFLTEICQYGNGFNVAFLENVG